MNFSNAPIGSLVPDRVIVEELQKLDPNLFVQPAMYEISKIDGRMLIFNDGKPHLKPRFHIWIGDPQDKNKNHYLFAVENDDGSFRPLDRRVIDKIFGDIARTQGMTKEQILNLMENGRKEAVEKTQAKLDDLLESVLKENAPVINSERDLKTVRDQKAFSYAGQTHKDTSAKEIPLTNEEIGIIIPTAEEIKKLS